MTKTRNGKPDQADEGRQGAEEQNLERLFQLASSRPAPPEGDFRQVKEAVQDEWRAVTARRRWRRRVIGLSAAAGIVLAISMVVFNRTPVSPVPELNEMARVERISGQVQVFSQQSTGEGAALAMQMPVYLGQTLQTGSDSGISLRLGGISLRVDQESRLTLADENTVALEHGRLYVDTRAPAPLDAVAARDLQIRTDLGLVSHLGTQYLVQRRGDWLRVGVRDGGVRVDDPDPGVVATLLVPTGQELQLDDSGAQEITPFSSYGPEWQWAENLAPDFVLDGRTMAQFLDWVASETGLEIAYQSDRVRSVAEETMLHGKVDLPAKAALQLVLKTSDLSAEIRDGVIEISLKS